MILNKPPASWQWLDKEEKSVTRTVGDRHATVSKGGKWHVTEGTSRVIANGTATPRGAFHAAIQVTARWLQVEADG